MFALDKHQFTILRLRETLMVVFAQCLPIFVRIGLGQNLNPRSWGLLRVDTALRPPLVTNLRVYGIQLLSSSIAALVLASQLSSAIGLNKDYYQGAAAAALGGEDPADAVTNDAASLPPSASPQRRASPSCSAPRLCAWCALAEAPKRSGGLRSSN